MTAKQILRISYSQRRTDSEQKLAFSQVSFLLSVYLRETANSFLMAVMRFVRVVLMAKWTAHRLNVTTVHTVDMVKMMIMDVTAMTVMQGMA